MTCPLTLLLRSRGQWPLETCYRHTQTYCLPEQEERLLKLLHLVSRTALLFSDSVGVFPKTRQKKGRLHDFNSNDHRRISVFFLSLCNILTWIQIIFRSNFVAYKLPLHPLVSKQTSLVLAALGLSCSQSRVNWWRKKKFVINKISSVLNLSWIQLIHIAKW